MGKEEAGDGKEGRELLDFLAGDQKQIVLKPGIVGPSVRSSRRGRRGTLPFRFGSAHVTQQKWVRKQDPGRCRGNINSPWVRPAVAYRSFARPKTAGGHFDLLNFHTFLRDLGDDKGELKQHCSLGFSKALASDLKLEPLIRALTLTPVDQHPCSAIWKWLLLVAYKHLTAPAATETWQAKWGRANTSKNASYFYDLNLFTLWRSRTTGGRH